MRDLSLWPAGEIASNNIALAISLRYKEAVNEAGL
jgi:hypothetical protein